MERTTLHALPKSAAVDAVKELRLRQWARTHYIAIEKRPRLWHPIVLDEMTRMDREAGEVSVSSAKIYAVDGPMTHRPHDAIWANAMKTIRYEPTARWDEGVPTELFLG
ncbi:hypothetical protein [Lacunimicrobium album]